MPVASERLTGWLSPKWLVGAVALAADAMLFSYDWHLGLAASVLIGAGLAWWLYLALRYGSLSGVPSGRAALMARMRVLETNRRGAAALSAAQQGADPAKRA